MSPSLSKLQTVLGGLAVIVVVGLATPTVLGVITAPLFSHSAILDVDGPARFGVLFLDAVAWVAWLRISIGLCLDVASGLRQANGSQRPGGLRGYLAGWVLGLVLMVLPGFAMSAGAAGTLTEVAPVSLSLPAPDETAATVSLPTRISSTAWAPSVNSPATVAASPAATYVVVSGDCLSTIALRFYGDQGAWSEIWAANANRMMADGLRFGDPNLIYAGWTLILPGQPAASSTESTSPDPTPIPPVATSPPTGQLSPTPRADSPGASSQRNPSEPTESGSLHGGGNGSDVPAPVVVDDVPDAFVRWMPESASLGLSALVAAAYLRRIRKRRGQARAVRADDEVVAESDPAAVMLEARLAPFADVPVLEWLEFANRHLTSALRSEERTGPVPRVSVVRVGPDGVEMRLAGAVDWAPGAFTLSEDGSSWRLSADVDRTMLWLDACEELAWLPLLLPVGDDYSGTYLLHVEPGDVVSLQGPGGPSMLAAWAQAAKAWPWAEQLGVARDADTAHALAPLFVGQVTPEERATLLFIGDPGVLAETASAVVASVTSSPSLATTRVMVNAGVALVAPFGLKVRPCRLDLEAEGLLEALDEPRLIRVLAKENDASTASTEQEAGETASGDLCEAGPIEVRLLTFTPHIVGLAEPLPTNKAVRITELVAWMGLQGTKGTTTASMLDYGLVGAASIKTLYNMVSAARAALGTDTSGASRLTLDRGTGVYRLADEVTIDVLRFVQMAERGIGAEDPHVAAKLCRAALDLIDDIPVGNGSGRYGWWSSMWEARIGRLAIKAAGRLAELARHEVVDLEAARRGIEAARFTAGGEEELHRVAMVLEAWAGNDVRVEREWEVACAQADGLEAGSAPSAATESVLAAARTLRRDKTPVTDPFGD